MLTTLLWFVFLLPIAIFGGIVCVLVAFALISAGLVLLVEIMDARSVSRFRKPRSDRHAVGDVEP